MINRVEICGVNTSKLPVLSNEEKNELLKKIKDGDKEAREKFINGNLRLVLSVVGRFSGRGENADDLFQIGCVGLIKAIDNFDLSHDVKFSTYAVPLILGEIRRYLRDNSNLRVSRSIKDLAYKILKLKEEHFMTSGYELTSEAVAKKLGVEEIDVIIALDAMKDPVSMFEPIYNDGGDTIYFEPIYNDGGDTIYLEDQIESKKDKCTNWDLVISLNDAIKDLKEKEKMIITERYLIGKTQMEIAEEIGISQAQVSRLEKGGIENIKRKMM